MKAGMVGAIALAILSAAGGYWLGSNATATAESATPPSVVVTTEQAREPLYYRHPMGLPDTSPTPKKDSMGMDYIPVYAQDQAANTGGSNPVVLSVEKVQKLGVRTKSASLQTVHRPVRATGRVEPDERHTYAIAPRFEGYVERLHVNATGQSIGKGQPLFEVYSPELVAAQREYAIAADGLRTLAGADAETQAGMRQLAESSLTRLRNWEVSAEQITALSTTGRIQRTLSFRSPVAGVVTVKNLVQGMRFMPGEMLYEIADLSRVWVIADVFEQDLGLIQEGAPAKVRINAYPAKVFDGTIDYVYPTLNAETRTVPVRLELANADGLLKPGMFAEVELATAEAGPVLAVPVSAVIDSGTRRIVLVDLGEGRFEPREVEVGSRSDTHIEVRSGVTAGEAVVVAANFLIDAESNLQAAIGGFGHAGHGEPAPAASPEPAAPAAQPGHDHSGH